MNPLVVSSLVSMIEKLRADLGEHDADEILRADMIEGETDADAILSKLIRAHNVAKADAAGACYALNTIITRYKAREASAESRIEAIRAMIAKVLDAMGEKSRKRPEGTVSLSDGRKSLVLADDFKPPQGYRVEKIEPDKAAIRAALQNGAEIPGASLVSGNPVLTVR